MIPRAPGGILPRMRTARLFLLAAFCAAGAAAGDRLDRDYADELPRVPPLDIAAAARSIAVQPGYRVELAASEPLARDPIALAFDEEGGLYVLEMRGYSEERKALISGVRRLTDADGDGVFDTAATLVEGLEWPTAIACWDGGLFVADPPDLWYFKDTTGDGAADLREHVLTGFGTANVQGLVNTFLWGLDNRYHAAISSSGAELRAPGGDTPPLTLRGRDLAFDPRTRAIAAISGGGQHGASFDDWGRRYVCHNSDHIMLLMFEDHYAARNPWVAAPNPRISIAADGPAADVFRISPVEAWREVRTRLRAQGLVPGPLEGGGRAAGYFTSATGITLYRGDTWPAADRGLAIVADVGSNLIHRKRLEAKGLEQVARRVDEGAEFIASTDLWFRPVQFANGPDGHLYFADMHREVVEHPDSLPPIIKKHLDLNSGNDRGRIYRIVPEHAPARPWPRLGRADTRMLVAALAHPNAWHRETASRLLYARQPEDAAPLLRAMAADAATPPVGRLHALHALSGLDALDPDTLLSALEAEDPRLRARALRLAEDFTDSGAVRAAMAAAAGDPDAWVRYQLAFSLGALPVVDRVPIAAAIARRDAADPWVRFALLSSLAEGADGVIAALASDPEFTARDGARELLAGLAEVAGAATPDEALADLLLGLLPLAGRDPALRDAVRTGLITGAQNARRGRAALDLLGMDGAGDSGLVQQALETAVVRELDEATRARAVRALGLSQFERVGETLAGLLTPDQPAAVQVEALRALRQFDTPDAARPVVAQWGGFSPAVRGAALEMLFARPAYLTVLLDEVEQGRFRPAQLESTRIAQLRAHPDPAVRAHALRSLPPPESLARRADVVEAYRHVLGMRGNAAKGRQLFALNCAQCHRVGDLGHVVGPDLANAANGGLEKLLVNILDPNREVNPQYLNYVIDTKDWETHSGIIVSETATSVTVARANGFTDTILRENIESIRSAELSLMPEGWEAAFKPADMADLLAYLMSLTGASE